MSTPALPGRLGEVRMDGELPCREDLPLIFDELDHQLAVQAYLWSLPLVSYAQWQTQHRDVFGATDYDLVHNADGSVDLTFGPGEPASTANWVQTIPGRHWFAYFRFYGPLEPYFDRSWKLDDITRA
jgi:hypothetical protein